MKTETKTRPSLQFALTARISVYDQDLLAQAARRQAACLEGGLADLEAELAECDGTDHEAAVNLRYVLDTLTSAGFLVTSDELEQGPDLD